MESTSSERDEELEQLRLRVQHLEKILALNGLEDSIVLEAAAEQASLGSSVVIKEPTGSAEISALSPGASETNDEEKKEDRKEPPLKEPPPPEETQQPTDSKETTNESQPATSDNKAEMPTTLPDSTASEPNVEEKKANVEEKKDDKELPPPATNETPTTVTPPNPESTQPQAANDENQQVAKKEENDYHPPGTQPGGTWYKQSYKGARTQNLSALACCCIGPTEGYIASQVGMDARYVYFNRNGNQQFYSEMGNLVDGVSALESTLTVVPAQILKDRRRERDQTLAPPGLEEGGLWYKQYIQGNKYRMIYRPQPCGMDFYNKKGQKVNLFEGPVEPPVSMASLL